MNLQKIYFNMTKQQFPKFGKKYYYLYICMGDVEIGKRVWLGARSDFINFCCCNFFKTKAEAKKLKSKILRAEKICGKK